MIDLFGRQARRELELLQAINKGIQLRNLDLRDLIDNLEVDLAIAKSVAWKADRATHAANGRADVAEALIAKHKADCRKGKVNSDLAKAKARAEKVAKTLADLPAALAPMDVAA